MGTIDYLETEFAKLQSNSEAGLSAIREEAFTAFSRLGIPSARNEEWKYTRVAAVLNRSFQFAEGKSDEFSTADLNAIRLPGSAEANEIVFLNGRYVAQLSCIRSAGLTLIPLEEAANGPQQEFVATHFGNSSKYLKDGINAMSTAFMSAAIFLDVKKSVAIEHPVYIYNISDARTANVLSQPRSLIRVGENAQVQLVETFATIGSQESFTNQVMELVVEKDAIAEYYKIQNDSPSSNQVSTTHIRQTGKSYTHAVTISLDGGMVRNNLNLVLDAPHCEAHMYGLYFQKGKTHIDNHTVVDNAQPNCLSNELYKGILTDNATGVFNGKIFVRPLAQKTNAYQSNKNVLLSDSASVNTKPQLEIYADDVKCSHGCTVGQLDNEALFYLQSRGINEKRAVSLLLHGFAIDILEKIKLAPIRAYVEGLIDERLEFDKE